MINAAAIATALSGLVGWRPATEPDELPAALTASRSGLYVQDLNELLTLDVLAHIAPRTEPLADWLARIEADALKRFVINLTAAQSLDGKVLLPQTKLLPSPGRIHDTVNKQGRFVGIEFSVLRRQVGVTYELPLLSLQLDAALTEPLRLYLYSSDQPEPEAILTVPVGNKAGYPFLITPEELDLSFLATYGTKCWLGYYEADLPLGVHAIEREVGPCNCTYDPFAIVSEYLAVSPFSAPSANTDTGWLSEDITYQGGSYGLNLEFTAYCDVATSLQSLGNQTRLAPSVQMALAIRALEAIISSPNVTQLTGRPDVQADAYAVLTKYQALLYGGKDSSGDAYYPSMLKNLTLDLSGLDKACQAQVKSRLTIGRLSR